MKGYLRESYSAEHAKKLDLTRTVAHPALLKLLGRVKGLSVLDLGCGDGALATTIAKRGARVTGLDRDEQQIPKHHRKNLTLKTHDLNKKLPFADESFDAVIASLVLDHLKNPKKTVKEARRVLKKDGLFYCAIPNPLFDQEEMVAGMREGGGELDIFGNYFVERPITHEYDDETIITYHRPLESYFSLFKKTGFRLVVFKEARATSKAKKNAIGYAFTKRNPYFLLFKLEK